MNNQTTSIKPGPVKRWLRAIATPATMLVLAFSAICNCTAIAQAYPVKPIRMIVPFPPGGPADIASRVIAKKLSEALGQQMILENRSGAGGTIGLEVASKSNADGYTLVLGSLSTLSIAPIFNRNLSYDPVKSFAPICLIASSPSVLVINPSIPAASLRELIDLAKAKPGQLNFGTNGNGTIPHMAAEMFKTLAGVDIVHVPYKGVGLAANDLIAGQIQLLFTVSSGLEPYLRAGKLRALAVAGNKRLATLPDVPTTAEAGLPGLETGTWFGLMAPRGTPPDVVQRLHAETIRALAAGDVRDALSQQAFELLGNSPDQFAEFIGSEIDKWARVVKTSGVKLN
jgi:tripartite-type tricarboxylate transporter receptor subunit TctC